MLRLIGFTFVFLLCSKAAKGEWQIATSNEELSPNDLVVYRQTLLENPSRHERAILHCAVFAARVATLEMIDQPQPPRRDLSDVMAERNALAGVNGGYFDSQDAPVGLLMNAGKILSPLRHAKLLSGVLFATDDKVDIVRTNRFSASRNVQGALQCGPLLLESSAPVRGLNDLRRARRTFAVVDGKGHAALGVMSAVSLADASDILNVSNALGKMKATRALNLDGGSSSAFWFAGRAEEISIPELKSVRDLVAIVPKKTR
jgi:uncharacterized protein YigE (DUF2233 family)